MLVLSRRKDESITIILPDGRKILIVNCDHRIGDRKIAIGVDAPSDIKVIRSELEYVEQRTTDNS